MCVCAYMYVFVSRDLGLGLARSLGSDDWLEVTVRSLSLIPNPYKPFTLNPYSPPHQLRNDWKPAGRKPTSHSGGICTETQTVSYVHVGLSWCVYMQVCTPYRTPLPPSFLPAPSPPPQSVSAIVCYRCYRQGEHQAFDARGQMRNFSSQPGTPTLRNSATTTAPFALCMASLHSSAVRFIPAQ